MRTSRSRSPAMVQPLKQTALRRRLKADAPPLAIEDNPRREAFDLFGVGQLDLDALGDVDQPGEVGGARRCADVE